MKGNRPPAAGTPRRAHRRKNTRALAARTLACALLVAVAGPVPAQDAGSEASEAPPPPTLSELAAEADLVALVQVLDTDYEYARDFPVGGTAFLRVLIPYKLDQPLPDIIEVYEEGLHEGECYFPNPPVTEEGRRYLVFVRRNPDVAGQYLGLGPGCSLTALVTADNRYALRYPPEGLEVADDLETLAVPIDFADKHAVLDYEALDPSERNALLQQGLLEEREERRYKLTHGIALGDARALLGEDNLTRDRALLRPAPADGGP